MKFINRIPNTNTWVEWSSEDIGSDWKPFLWALATVFIGAPLGIYLLYFLMLFINWLCK